MDVISRPLPLASSWLEDRQATRFVTALAAYFLLHVLIRLGLSDSLDLDEAEQVFEFQQVRMGYGTQPPLYNWLQWLLFSVFGLNLFALSLLKNLLLFATYLTVFLLARRLAGSACAMAASASMLLLPQIGWESQRDLTHSVLLTTIAAATLYTYFSVLRRPGLLRYAAFGLLVGLGMQTKYNFAMFTAGLAAASLMVPEHRAMIWNRRIAVSVGVAVLCLMPHGLWVLGNLDTAAGGTMEKLNSESRGGYLANVASGLGSMLLAAVSFITPLWLIYAVLCRQHFRNARLALGNPHARFFLCLYGAYFGCILVLVLTGEVTKVKDRWMQPMLFSAPLAFFLLLPALALPLVLRRILQAAGIAAACILIALPLRVYLGPATGKYVRAHYPFPALAGELASRFPQARTILAADRLVAGNLHFHQPRLRTIRMEELLEERSPLQGEVVMVMRDKQLGDWLERFRAAYPQARLTRQHRIALPYRYGSRDQMSFDVLHFVVPGASPL